MNNSNRARIYNTAGDFLNDAGFINFHFKLNAGDEFWWNNWIENHPDQAGIINEARGILNMLSLTLPDSEYNTELEQIKSTIEHQSIAGFRRSIFHLPLNRRYKLAAAASIVVLVISGILLFNFFSGDQTIKDRLNDTKSDLTITLEDNSTVVLSPGSRLTYQPFSSSRRDVTLQGSGNFNVTNNKNAPFRVYTGKIVSTVLGTSFNINCVDASITVDLITGSLNVALISSDSIKQEILLEPGQRVLFDSFKLVKVDNTPGRIENDNDRHDIHFSRNNFLQIAEIIRKTYGVVLINKSGNNNWKFSGQFKNNTAQEIIESICLIKGLRNSVQGDTIVIR